ncbi:replication-relaxation family protein [Heyndrickxia oleronia]|uniref:replication-relaxation family protein n=1 Tax=Heyndrickxia oleronia TaxID=38875 RepID=UPI00203AE693|nr:replication-relaxation family protein [Heyndrickxia oleronia]MCM3239026.1 replication-relaxation family protein [Heyndrickxia oleronia]
MNIEKEKRIDLILLLLKKCDYLTREQIQRMVNLGKTRNAQRVLKDLSNYISSFTDDKKNVYYLNSNGRERVQAEKVRKKTAMVTHYLMRNDLYITVGRPVSWRNEVEISINNVSLIADAAYISDKLHHFIEVDNKQSMSNNIQKIKKYKKLSTYHPQFVLIWVTTTPYRKKKLESLSQGLKFKIYLWEDLK